MARISIEVRTRTITEVVVLDRVIQAADGRLVAEGHPDSARLAASVGAVFTLEQALAEGLVRRSATGSIIGATVEPIPTPEEEE